MASQFDEAAAEAQCLLTVDEMYRADRATMDDGTSGTELMENAGAAVAREIVARWTPRTVAVLAGPGNNGGDGFVVARHLAGAGWTVRVGLLGDRVKLKGDAAWAAESWPGPVDALDPSLLDGAGLVVDALFGAGLSRPVDGIPAQLLARAEERKIPVVAVDVPSGVHGDSGAVLGMAARAALTVTFFRRKPGHLLLPGRLRCGETAVADIGIPDSVLGQIAPRLFANDPDLWRRALPRPSLDTHKYRRGHVLVLGGGEMTGAGRLAARGAMRGGAGMVTVACPPEAAPVYQTAAAALLTTALPDAADLAHLVEDRKVAAIVAGPGLGREARTRALVEACLGTGVPLVLDADALTAFAGDVLALARRIAGPVVLTPHDGEFARLFATPGGTAARARRAAEASGAVVVLKGGDTVVADPESGVVAINANAPAWLATAGAGDVLAGIVAALLGGGMPAFPGACAGVWLHGAAATAFGPGLIADDLPEVLPAVFSAVYPKGAIDRG